MKMNLTHAISGICFSLSLLSNPCIADDEATPPPEQTPPQTAPKPAPPKPAPTVSIETVINQYFGAWRDHDFKKMKTYENWEGGKELNDVQYIQAFNSRFKVHDWKISQVIPLDNNEYKILISVDHTPPKKIMVSLPPWQKTARSTLYQWWKKQDNTFVHLFHIERERIVKELFPVMPPLPTSPPADKATPK